MAYELKIFAKNSDSSNKLMASCKFDDTYTLGHYLNGLAKIPECYPELKQVIDVNSILTNLDVYGNAEFDCGTLKYGVYKT